MTDPLSEFSELEHDLWRMSLSDEEMFGKNDDVLEIRIPSGLKAALQRRAAEQGRTAAATARYALVLHLYGPEYVGMMVARRYGVVPTPVPTDVRTNVPATDAVGHD